MIAMAAGSPAFEIKPVNQNHNSPSWLVYNVKPGDSVKDEVMVSNGSDNPITLLLYPAETKTVKEPGAFVLNDRGTPLNDIGKWITLSKESVTLPAKSEEKIMMTLTVPANAVEKEYQAGIVAHLMATPTTPVTSKKDDTNATSMVTVSTRSGLRLYATVSKTAVTSDPIGDAKAAAEKAAMEVAAKSGATPATAAPSTNAGLFTPMNIIIALIGLVLICLFIKMAKGSGSKSGKK